METSTSGRRLKINWKHFIVLNKELSLLKGHLTKRLKKGILITTTLPQ